MVKRKSAKKMKSVGTAGGGKPKVAHGKTSKDSASNAMPMPALLMKILAVFLSLILVVALTLYVLGRMPARGFWVLIILLAIIGFVVMPAMRKRFGWE